MVSGRDESSTCDDPVLQQVVYSHYFGPRTLPTPLFATSKHEVTFLFFTRGLLPHSLSVPGFTDSLFMQVESIKRKIPQTVTHWFARTDDHCAPAR